jgi:hypothetical protein
MPLEKLKAEHLIDLMRSQDVQQRLDAINKARAMFTDTFKGAMTDADWAFSAYIIETFYNLIKDELKLGIQERIGKAHTENGIPTVKAPPREKKVKPTVKTMDMASMLSSFAAFQKLQQGK